MYKQAKRVLGTRADTRASVESLSDESSSILSMFCALRRFPEGKRGGEGGEVTWRGRRGRETGKRLAHSLAFIGFSFVVVLKFNSISQPRRTKRFFFIQIVRLKEVSGGKKEHSRSPCGIILD